MESEKEMCWNSFKMTLKAFNEEKASLNKLKKSIDRLYNVCSFIRTKEELLRDCEKSYYEKKFSKK